MSATDGELLALAAKWRERAKTFTREAHESGNPIETNRLIGMASSLKFASDDLCFTARINPNDVSVATDPEADHAIRASDNQLAQDSKEPQP